MLDYVPWHLQPYTTVGSGKKLRQDSGDSLDKSKAGRRSSTRKFEKSGSRFEEDDSLEEMEDEPNEPATEDYWFLCKRWLARSEDDGKIVRELIATDEHGKPLKGGLQGKEYKNISIFNYIISDWLYFCAINLLVFCFFEMAKNSSINAGNNAGFFFILAQERFAGGCSFHHHQRCLRV